MSPWYGFLKEIEISLGYLFEKDTAQIFSRPKLCKTFIYNIKALKD